MYMDSTEARKFCSNVLEAVGCPLVDADIIAKIIIDANVDGIDSHGISRLPIYVKRLKENRINPQPKITWEKRKGVLIVDGDNGIGQIVTHKAMQEALNLASDQGIASVVIRNSNHFGQAGYYCKQAARQKAFCMITTNSPKGIPPLGGKEAYFGTNPIAFGFPYKEEPVIVDMSSSIVARGKIILAAKNNQSIPEGWAIDQDGRSTTSAKEALHGAILPFGGAKGYALALSMEILAGILSGAAFGPHVQSIYKEHDMHANVGHFFIVSQVSHYMDYDRYEERMEQMMAEIKDVPLVEENEEIMIPGERKRKEAIKRLETGIPLSAEVYNELVRLSEDLNITFPECVENMENI